MESVPSSELTPNSPVPNTNDTSIAKKLLAPKYIVIYLVVAIVVYGFIYFIFLSKNSSFRINLGEKTDIAAVETPQLSANEIVIILDNFKDPSFNGLAFIGEEGDKIRVQISIPTENEATPSLVNIYEGKCQEMGQIKYTLNDVVSGSSETTIDTSIKNLRDEFPLFISVHKSSARIGESIACGELK